jgi:hypothetical protein
VLLDGRSSVGLVVIINLVFRLQKYHNFLDYANGIFVVILCVKIQGIVYECFGKNEEKLR